MSISLNFPASAATGWVNSIARRMRTRRTARRELDAFMHLDPAVLADIGMPQAVLSATGPGAATPR